MLRALLWAAAVLAAAAGVVLYAAEPRDLTYWAHILLTVPLLLAVMHLLSRRLPDRLQWALALALAPLGPIAYLLWPNEQWFLYGALTVLPLILLGEQRAERRGEPEPAAGFDGPWGLP